MKGSGKIVAGIIFIGIVVWISTPIFAQTTIFTFPPDGSISRKHVSDFGISIVHYDQEMRLLENSHYFPGGVRMRMSDKYRYENNMMVERIAYIYTQGYEKETQKFNQKGYEVEGRSYISQTEGNWKEIRYMLQGYDERNNRSYFRVKYTGYGSLVNSMSRTTYDYPNRTRTRVDYEFDANDREISSSSHKGRLADWQYERAGEFVFDIKKHGENLRPDRVVNWTGRDQNGNRIEKVFVNSSVFYKTVDRNGRVIRIVFGSPSWDEDNNPTYDEDETIEFRYDQQGRLVETESKHYSESHEKTIFKHGRKVEAKHYRMNKNGSWKLIDTKIYDNLDLLTPGKKVSGNHPVATSIRQENPEVYQAPIAQSSSTTKSPTSQSLVKDLNGLEIESGQSEALSAFSMDAERLTHIADVLSHATGVKVTEEQVLALAMQLLIENYNADLREMNTAYLRDKISVFD
ncbi:MAG: hypothetical protein COA38_15795 [Fluviicola sp.]|nr:MAG: hypothetical protein COA38_15795 [Fluviicola sp.]